MTTHWLLRGCVLCIISMLSHPFTVAQAQHDRAFWRAIAQNKYAVPAGASADALSQELSTMLASADPELRDELAYSIFPLLDQTRQSVHNDSDLPPMNGVPISRADSAKPERTPF